jgi:hypothetical protein
LDKACGAAIGAYNTLKESAFKTSNEHQFDEEVIKHTKDPYDEQFSYIINALKPKFNKICLMRKDENAATAYAMYELVRDYILKICISTPSIKGKIVICGGIQINKSYH